MTAPVAMCAHLKISYHTEQFEGDVQATETMPGGRQMLTRGWWECDYKCGMKFYPSLDPIQMNLTAKEAVVVHMLHLIGGKLCAGEWEELLQMRRRALDFLDEHFTDADAEAVRIKMTKLGDDIPVDELIRLGITRMKATT